MLVVWRCCVVTGSGGGRGISGAAVVAGLRFCDAFKTRTVA